MALPQRSRMRVTRRIAADPTSTALLLAGPTAVELWPGARRIGEADGRLLVEAEPPTAPAPELFAVRALPPQRTPTAYVTRFEWAGAGGETTRSVSCRLTLAYAPTADGTPVTHAVLECDVDDDAPMSVLALTAMGEGFLANLARAAETRNRAA